MKMAGELQLPLLLVVMSTIATVVMCQPYQPTWASLDTRPLPTWYDEAKFGIFLHWGVFSVPSYNGAWFWYNWKVKKNQDDIDFMKKNYPPGFTYADFASQFKAEFYDPNHWADIFKAAGAKYVVLTSKHHEGFCNWPTKYSWNWNSMDVGPKRDLVGELAVAIRNRTDIRFGLYHSLYEWFNPLYLSDKANNFTTRRFVEEKTMPELYELVKLYKPEVVWSDGAIGDASYFKSKEFLAWLYNESPVKDTVVTNDRWGTDTICHHGGYYTCHDKYNPGHLIKHKWENCWTVDKSLWAYRRKMDMHEVESQQHLVAVLVQTVSCGGNLLMNVGPTPDGRIIPIFEERLRGMGDWLKVNGEAIYSSKPWSYQNDTLAHNVWFTSKSSAVYAILLDWPSDTLQLAAPRPSKSTTVTMLGVKQSLQWQPGPKGGIMIKMPILSINEMPCKWAWVLKMTQIG